ncbi:MAG: UvrD-helicase domain-containing protein, partial [bacterium]
MDLFKELNEQQKQAVLHQTGPLLVVAGAGAGKTKVITHRIANLIKNGIKPEEILAVTFTNKAADEMKNRVRDLVSNSPTIGTFHSICARMLRENAGFINRPRNFSILDKEDSLRIIKNSLKNLEIDPKQFQPAKMSAIISRQKSELVSHNQFLEEAGLDFFPKTLALIWQEYERNLDAQKALDFDDLISKTVFLFQKKPEVLKKYQDKWKYILIDEYQDTNHSQYVLVKLLAQKHKNICVVGDEDQSIYRFRGANFGNILKFEKDWPNVTTVMLEQNYRSSQKILDAANAVIKQNKARKPKNLFSKLKKETSLNIFDAINEKEEAEFIAQTCHEEILNGTKPSDMTVLFRANFQSRVLEEAFLNHEIPYQVVGAKFFDRKEIKDIIAYIKAALNTNDFLSLSRIINEPSRGLGKTSLMNHIAGKKLAKDKEEKIGQFYKLLENIKQNVLKEPLSKTILYVIKRTG